MRQIMVCFLVLMLVACSISPTVETLVAVTPKNASPTPIATHTPRPTATHTPTPTRTLTPTINPASLPVGAAFKSPTTEKGVTCFGTDNDGLTCLDESGWHIFTKDNSELKNNSIWGIAKCPNRIMIIAHGLGISLWDGETWLSHYNPSPYGENDYPNIQDVTCGKKGEIWITHKYGASNFDGFKWTDYDNQHVLANFDDPQVLVDCDFFGCLGKSTISPNGDFWTLVKGYLVHFNGSTWIPIEIPKAVNKIVSDSKGQIWAISDNALHKYSNGSWNEFQKPDGGFSKITDLLIDIDDRAWMSTWSGEVLVFDDGNWLSYDATDGRKIDSELTHIALDGRGRLWVGSEWGLNVFDGTTWTAYHMHTADIGNYVIGPIAVLAGGPDLPPPVEKEKGKVTGRFLWYLNENPVATMEVNVCQFHMDFILVYVGSPCSNKPFFREATTDNNGNFRIDDLPPGYYSLFYLSPNGKWDYKRMFLVTPGQETQLSDIKIEQ